MPWKCGEHPEHSHPPACGFPRLSAPPNSESSTKSMYGEGPSLARPIFAVPSMTMSSSACENGYDLNMPANPWRPYAVPNRESAEKSSPPADDGKLPKTSTTEASPPAAPAADAANAHRHANHTAFAPPATSATFFKISVFRSAP
eukprot:29833-Pelagococcus_subviridis.AAC.2